MLICSIQRLLAGELCTEPSVVNGKVEGNIVDRISSNIVHLNACCPWTY